MASGHRLAIDLQKIASQVSFALYALTFLFIVLTFVLSYWFSIGAVVFLIPLLIHINFKHVQRRHTLLRNFGIFGWARYLMEGVGPEMRQYFFLNDTEERPFNRTERAEVYRKAKNVDSAEAFGSQKEYNMSEIKLKHSFFPMLKEDVDDYRLTFGEERKLENSFTITKPFMISAMSFGALGKNAVRSLARGARMSGIAMNTGEGGFPKYHLLEKPDVIFQMGTAKFGCRNEDGSLNDEKLERIARIPEVRMIEIKLSQGAKPGKGGLLPKEKITREISKLRGVPMDKDVVSPPRHIECTDVRSTVKFIKRVQDVSKLPVGIKFCLGREDEFTALVKEMKKQKTFPDYIAVDGAEGGTGAAPKSFMDGLGLPVYSALDKVNYILKREKVRDKLKLVASGKLLNTRKQMLAFAHGADAIYIARGFMFALGCIQALQCNKDTCPVGITTHDPKLQRGLVIGDKARRVANYANNMNKEFKEILASMGVKNIKELKREHVYEPHKEGVKANM